MDWYRVCSYVFMSMTFIWASMYSLDMDGIGAERYSPHAAPNAVRGRVVHVFGDSHACYGFTSYAHPLSRRFVTQQERSYIPIGTIMVPLAIHWLGSVTMFRVGRDNAAVVDFISHGVRDGDIVVFVFGEIDVRCHIGRIRDQHQRNLSEIINSLVVNYLQAIKQKCANYPHIIPVITTASPPNDYAINPAFPRWGLLSDRVAITRQLNATLTAMAPEQGISVLDPYGPFMLPDGSLDPAMSDGVVHIAAEKNEPVRTALSNLILEVIEKGQASGTHA